MTPAKLSESAGISPNALLRLERDEAGRNDWVLGRVLRWLGPKIAMAFPGIADVYDFLVPPQNFGSWLRNFRLRRGLQQEELAEAWGISNVSVCRYERNLVKPGSAVLQRLRETFGLQGEFKRFRTCRGAQES